MKLAVIFHVLIMLARFSAVGRTHAELLCVQGFRCVTATGAMELSVVVLMFLDPNDVSPVPFFLMPERIDFEHRPGFTVKMEIPLSHPVMMLGCVRPPRATFLEGNWWTSVRVGCSHPRSRSSYSKTPGPTPRLLYRAPAFSQEESHAGIAKLVVIDLECVTKLGVDHGTEQE